MTLPIIYFKKCFFLGTFTLNFENEHQYGVTIYVKVHHYHDLIEALDL